VIFFTHHRHLIELAHGDQNLAEQIAVHNLHE
jgi:hypothetical protein